MNDENIMKLFSAVCIANGVKPDEIFDIILNRTDEVSEFHRKWLQLTLELARDLLEQGGKK